MNARVLLIALMSVTVVLAGCTDESVIDDTPPGALVDKDNYNLGSKGAINGLIVDDNFRPVQLKEDWGAAGPGDFQDIGFVLILETGQQLETSENGEFQVLPLDPGTYTIRVSAELHEAIDKEVEVVAGEFTDVNVIARRTANAGGQILTEQYSIFVDCWWYGGAAGWWTELNCFGDMSLDSKRAGFQSHYEAISDEVTYLVSEFLFNKEGTYEVYVGYAEGESITEQYTEMHPTDTDYHKMVLYNIPLDPNGDGCSEEDYCFNGADRSERQDYYDAAIEGNLSHKDALDGYFVADIQFLTGMAPMGGVGLGNDPVFGFELRQGFGTSTKATIVNSVFIGEPDVDLAEYCAICEDESDIPQ